MYDDGSEDRLLEEAADNAEQEDNLLPTDIEISPPSPTDANGTEQRTTGQKKGNFHWSAKASPKLEGRLLLNRCESDSQLFTVSKVVGAEVEVEDSSQDSSQEVCF